MSSVVWMSTADHWNRSGMKPKPNKTRPTRQVPPGGALWQMPAGGFPGRRAARDNREAGPDRPWKLLFVDNSDESRSQAAAAFCRTMISSQQLNIEVTAAGVRADAVDPVVRGLLPQVDAILAMDPSVVSALVAAYGVRASCITCLYIPEIHDRNGRELQVALEAALRRYLLVLGHTSRTPGVLDARDGRISGGTAQAN